MRSLSRGTSKLLAVLASLIAIALIITIGVLIRRNDNEPEPDKPSSVPTAAVLVRLPKNYWWKYCWYEPVDSQDHCRVFNRVGDLITDDIFLPYDGGPPLQPSELQIDSQLSFGDWVWLKNGRILLPQSNFARVKSLLNGIAPQPKS